jgi:hypothetical protein
MVKVLNIVILVLCGVVGAWVGYWVGYALGWATNASWPGTIGGGTGAILLSIGTSVLSVVVAASAIMFLPQFGVGRVLADGVPVRATVLGAVETGAQSRSHGETRRQVRCDLEVCPPDGASYRARATQFVTRTFEDGLRPGATVVVRVDPAAPRHIALDEERSLVA